MNHPKMSVQVIHEAIDFLEEAKREPGADTLTHQVLIGVLNDAADRRHPRWKRNRYDPAYALAELLLRRRDAQEAPQPVRIL
jgi:hypothetical protein